MKTLITNSARRIVKRLKKKKLTRYNLVAVCPYDPIVYVLHKESMESLILLPLDILTPSNWYGKCQQHS